MPVRPLPPDLAVVVVPGITWYRDRQGDVRAVPAQTVVPAQALLSPLAPDGRYAFLSLPAGDFPVDGRTLPLEPLPVEAVFPLGRAEVPWRPEQQHGAVDLRRDWRLLFRERDAFAPWGPAAAVVEAPWRAYARAHRPRPTFRTGADRRQMRFIYPQLVPPHLCHRLGPGYLRLAERQPFGAICVEGTEFHLRAGPQRTATVGADPLGWRVAVRRSAADDPQTARHPEEALRLLAAASPFWDLAVQPGGARLLAIR